MEHDCNKAAVMVINAMLVSTPDDVYLIKSRSRLEAEFDLSNALRSLSELINLGVADASDYLLYGQLLYSVEKDQQAAGDALSHALAICEPSDRFDMLVTCANSKGVMGDLQGALEYFAEADSLGQLNFNDLKRLGELQVIVGDRAAALDPLNRAAAMEPNNASVRQQQGACKLFAEDHAGAVADLDAAILHGERSTLTYRCRGIANLRLGQLDTALADLDQAVAEESEQQHLCEALVWRAEVKHELANHMDAVADMDRASNIQPLAYHHQFQHFHYRQLAKGAASSEDIPGARQDVSNANVQQHPDAELAQTLTNQGRTLCENHRFEAALAALNKADNLRPNNSDTLVWRGTAKLCLDNCAGAVADYDAAEQQAPLEEHVLAKRLVAKLNLGTLGLEDVQKADEKKALLKAEKTQGSWFTDQV